MQGSATMELTILQLLGIYLSCILSDTIQVTHFTRISAKHITSLSCGVSCASDSQCSGYLVRVARDCNMIADGDLETACFSASVSPACYGRNNDVTTLQPYPQTTTVPTTVEETTPQPTVFVTTQLPATPQPTVLATTQQPTTLQATLLVTTQQPTTLQPTVLVTTQQQPTPEGCVESIRQGESSVRFINIRNTDNMVKYTDISDYLTGASGTVKSRSSKFPDMVSNVRDLYYLGNSYIVVIDGK